jgi:hypothetical protein
VIESLQKGCYIKKDAKFLKRIEQQGDNYDELINTDVSKDFKDCIENLKVLSSDTQQCITEFFDENLTSVTKY